MRIEKILVVIVVFFGSLLACGVVHAQTPSALVLEKSGASVPEIKPYSEIPVGTKISLPSGGRLVFLHYYTCQTVAVVGSTITFGAETYTITGGTKEREVRAPCPRTVILKAGGEVAGTLIRSGAAGGALGLTTSPTFVLVGPRADDFTAVRVSRGDKGVLEAPLEGRRFRWPIDAAPLAVDTEYELGLVPTVRGTVPVTMKFRTHSPAATPPGDGLTLISAE